MLSRVIHSKKKYITFEMEIETRSRSKTPTLVVEKGVSKKEPNVR